MANINKIKLSGQTYDIQDPNASKTVELTQAQYDALVTGGTVDPNTFYIITDAEGGDLANYYTKSQTSGATQISTALNAKQNTLVAGDNITISGNVISATGGGGGGSSYTAGAGIDITNDVISVSGASHNSLADGTQMLLRGDVTTVGQNYSNIEFNYYYGTSSNRNKITLKPLTINGNSALRTQALSISVVETSAITTSVTSSSTDSQVPSAKAVYDQLGGLKLQKITQSAYDALATKDANTLYVING